MTPGRATARACANIALVKYWGKRDAAQNLPAQGSLSLTLDALVTETTVEFDPALSADTLALVTDMPALVTDAPDAPDAPDATVASHDGAAELARTTAFLDLVRARARITTRARVTSTNHFPTASGLASSASGFAALAMSASRAAGLELTPRELSILARRGSGSAARSIFSGFVRMHAGDTDADAYAEPIASSLTDRVRMVIAVVGGGVPKTHASRDAMEHSAATSPLYRAWLDQVPRDLATAEHALATGDLVALGEVTEANALAMHATAMASRPAIIYWQPTTLALLAVVRDLRAAGIAAWATMDAGPHVKVLTAKVDAARVTAALRACPDTTVLE